MEQAKQEFEARGLEVKTADTRAELMSQFRNNQSLEGKSGNHEITVVNIQRFAEDKEKVNLPAYATNLQRIFMTVIPVTEKAVKCFLSIKNLARLF